MKYFLILLVIGVGIGIYLNRAYAHIFWYFNENNPGCPKVNTTFSFTPSVSSTKKLVYVSLGDSLAAGAGAADEKESYPYLLAKLMAENGETNVTLQNIAEPGAESKDVLSKQVPQVADLHPDIVTLLIGVNDFHNGVPDKKFKENMVKIITELEKSTGHLYIVTIPFLGNRSAMWPPYRTYADIMTRHYNKLLKEAMLTENVSIIDLYTLTRDKALEDKGYYSRDGFHPSAATYNYWSKIIYDNLDQ